MTGQSRRSRAMQRSATAPHYLYRCYDDTGLLVYIGCSSDPARRMEQHRAAKNETSRLVADPRRSA
jgi:predicted GIY-YIG superfamily endonuclease